jgi:predicted ABC-type ATPase
MAKAQRQPHVIVLAGPNGAGKSTSAPALLKGKLGVSEFVNADVIASGLSAFEPQRVALQAGRLMLERLDELARLRADFAFETTLASRTFAPWLERLIERGYEFHLLYLSLPEPSISNARVTLRVALGGHHVPAETVERRFRRGIANFFDLYRPIATTWRLYDNSGYGRPMLVASGKKDGFPRILNRLYWQHFNAIHQAEQQARHRQDHEE